MRLSRIGLGTWQFGSREWGYGDGYATDVAPALIHRAVELGITMLDTAEAYGPGRSEKIIGEALPSLTDEERAGLVVATKFLPIAPAEPIVAWQAAGSRRRLGMDVLDLLYVHWKNPFVSARRVMQAMRPLVEEGLVRRAGVSNFTLAQWREAEAALRARGRGEPGAVLAGGAGACGGPGSVRGGLGSGRRRVLAPGPGRARGPERLCRHSRVRTAPGDGGPAPRRAGPSAGRDPSRRGRPRRPRRRRWRSRG